MPILMDMAGTLASGRPTTVQVDLVSLFLTRIRPARLSVRE